MIQSQLVSCDTTTTTTTTAESTKTLSLPDVTPIHIQAQIVQQEHISLIRFANFPPMRNSFHDPSPSSSRSRTRDSENIRFHSSSHRDHHSAREAAAHAVELSNLLDKCRLLESTLKARDKEIHDLRKERDRLLDDRKRMQHKLSQQEAAQATAVANALAAVARTPPTPPPKPSKYRSSTPSRPHLEDSGSSSTDSFSTSPSKKTSRTSMASVHGLPTYQDEYIAHLRSFDVFMTKTDSWSGAQVIQSVRDINSEILQFSASLTELHYAIDTNNGGQRPPISPNALSQAKQNTATRLGIPLMHLLSTRDHSQDSSMLVQFALQATLCTIIDRTLSSFYVGFPVKYDALLSQIYLRMCSTGQFFLFLVGRRPRNIKPIKLYRTSSHVIKMAFIDSSIHHYFISNVRRTNTSGSRGRRLAMVDGYSDPLWHSYTQR